MKDRLLVVTAHPDDETLGAAGTLLKYKQQGNKIFWFNFTDLKGSYGYSGREIKKRTDEIAKVSEIYDFDACLNLKLKPAGLGEYAKSDLVEKASGVISRLKPQILVLPFRNDAHSDHRIAFEAFFSAAKAFRQACVKTILMMEVASETDFASSDDGFVPNFFVDITDFLKRKMEIAKIYKGEIKRHPFPRSLENIRALATHRGASAGCRFAEGFVLLKHIE